MLSKTDPASVARPTEPLAKRLERHLAFASYVATYGIRLCRYPFLSTTAIFNDIYKKRIWDHAGSVSGDASTLEATELLRAEIPPLLEEYEVESMLDIPCGDFSWMSRVDLGDISYTGADIVDGLIYENRRKYADDEPGEARRRRSTRSFVALDICESGLPPVDVIFCRDCLVHLSYSGVLAALANIKRSGAKYLLMTTFPARKRNRNVITGAWRALNFERPPFSLPAPLAVINEGFALRGGRYPDKSMGLWRVADL